MTTAFDTSPSRQRAGWDDQERAALVTLLRTRPSKTTWPEITITVGEQGSALAVWNDLVPSDLFDDVDERFSEAPKGVLSWRETGLGFRTFMAPDFPAQLREIRERPSVLFHKGTLLDSDTGMCVVGLRSASGRGLMAARTIAEGLVQREITVVSVLAKGIDAAAHGAALEAGGRTVACIGTGITKCYPAENRSFQEEVARRGLVLSQFWPNAPPRKQSFPTHNVTMSGYRKATIVVEAGEHSGARIQARQAVEHGRPVILTDMVVQSNEWARSLLGRPGVYECGSAADMERCGSWSSGGTARPALRCHMDDRRKRTERRSGLTAGRSTSDHAHAHGSLAGSGLCRDQPVHHRAPYAGLRVHALPGGSERVRGDAWADELRHLPATTQPGIMEYGKALS